MDKLDHPNIIDHICWFKEEFFETNWNIEVVRYCYLMEYADDNDLLTHMKNKKHSKKV